MTTKELRDILLSHEHTRNNKYLDWYIALVGPKLGIEVSWSAKQRSKKADHILKHSIGRMKICLVNGVPFDSVKKAFLFCEQTYEFTAWKFRKYYDKEKVSVDFDTNQFQETTLVH